MIIKRNKTAILLLNIFLTLIFYIPTTLDKLFKSGRIGSPRKILILELWGIGDLVIMSSILKPLKKRFPGSTITLLSKSSARDIFYHNKMIDNIIEFDFFWTKLEGKYSFWRWDWIGLLGLIKRLRRESFDLVLDARGDIRNNLFSFIIGVRRRIGYNYTGGGIFLTDIVPGDYEHQHKVKSWLNLLEYMGIETGNSGPNLDISEETINWTEGFLKGKGIQKNDLLIGVHPGAGAKIRCWPLERFAKTAEYLRDRYKAKIIVFVEPNGYGGDIPINGPHIKVEMRLRDVIKIIYRLNLLICNDGGIMHVASAMNIPLVGIFGPGYLNWFRPYAGDNAVIIKKDNFRCSPCFDYCKHGQPLCLTSITAQEVKEAIDRNINSLRLIIPLANR